MYPDLLYQVALTMIPNIGPVHARQLIERFGHARNIFDASESSLLKMEGIGEQKARAIKTFHDYQTAEQEIAFIAQAGIQPLFITDPLYPKRLLNCYDAPTLLFYKGNADLNASRIISVIGTRHHSHYGKQVTEKLINELADRHAIIVSGLAYGIDGLAHKAALSCGLPTIGVLAHGLDQVYPPSHYALAQAMQDRGGLLTEFRSRVLPDRHHFPLRNRIVAGMSDATIVVETGARGGSMITAELANGYNRDVFAIPGRTSDLKSEGCNLLIRKNKACLLTSAADLVEWMGWEEKEQPKKNRQRSLFPNISDEERRVLDFIQANEPAHIDEINLHSHLSSSVVAASILSLELQNVVVSLPGKLYRLS